MKKIKNLFLTILLTLSIVSFAESLKAADVADVSKHLQEISVTIKSGNAQGSGVIFTRTNTAGETINLVWTAGHVVDNLRKTRAVVTPDGNSRTMVEFDDAQIVKILIENGRIVGRVEFDASILKFSDSDNGQDLAVLVLRKKNFIKDSVVFNSAEVLLPGTKLLHVGSLKGEFGANSMTDGIMSQNGRVLSGKEYDQSTCTAFPGSSGGGVYTAEGQYVGMLVRGSGEGFNLLVPMRRILQWADDNNVKWALDSSIPFPTEEELKKLAIEDVPPGFKRSQERSPQESGRDAVKKE